MKTKILGLLVIAVFFISTVSVAQQNSKQERGEMPNHRKAMMMKKHNMGQKNHQNFLTEEQKEKGKELRLETAKMLKPLKNELNELNAHQRTLTTADKADIKAINSNIDKISAVKTKMAKIQAAQHQEFRAMLTEEQLVKFDMMKQKRGEKGPRAHGVKDGKRADQRHQRG